MFIIRKKSTLPSLGSKPPKPIPTVLTAYGGFGIIKTPYFSPSMIMLLSNLNGLFVSANIRGGGEYGVKWHDDGCRANKKTSFDDF